MTRINDNERRYRMKQIDAWCNYLAALWRVEKFALPRYRTRDIAAKAVYVVSLDRELKHHAI